MIINLLLRCSIFLLDDELSKESSEVSDNDFNYTVKGEDWKEVLDAVKNQNEDELKSNLQKMNDEVQKQRLVNSEDL